MNWYYIYTRITHFVTAKHRHGHGIHSPMIYDFVRNVVDGNSRKSLVDRIEDHYPAKKVHYAITPDRLYDYDAFISIIHYPFKSKELNNKWEIWRNNNSCLSISLKNCIVIFWDTQLPNRHYKIRS